MCYVKGVGNFQYINGKWEEFNSNSNTFDDVTTSRDGNITTFSFLSKGKVVKNIDILDEDTKYNNEILALTNQKIDNIITYTMDNNNILEFYANGKIIKTLTLVGGNINNDSQPTSGGYYIGDTPPENKDLIWIDTSGSSIDKAFSSVVLDEIRELISSMNKKILALESKIAYLEANGGGNSNTPITPSGNTLIMEDGFGLLLETNKKIILEG